MISPETDSDDTFIAPSMKGLIMITIETAENEFKYINAMFTNPVKLNSNKVKRWYQKLITYLVFANKTLKILCYR